MIKPVNDIINLCGKDLHSFTDYELRLLAYNYIYYKKGVTEDRVLTASFVLTPNVKMGLLKAYRYFINFYDSTM